MRYSLVSRDWIADCVEIMHEAYAAVSPMQCTCSVCMTSYCSICSIQDAIIALGGCDKTGRLQHCELPVILLLVPFPYRSPRCPDAAGQAGFCELTFSCSLTCSKTICCPPDWLVSVWWDHPPWLYGGHRRVTGCPEHHGGSCTSLIPRQLCRGVWPMSFSLRL